MPQTTAAEAQGETSSFTEPPCRCWMPQSTAAEAQGETSSFTEAAWDFSDGW